MGQFKPMVKMMTTEPSVILKLKKGGKVQSKADGGYMPMQSTMPAQMPAGMPARGGAAPAASPMKPSMAMRRRAMNPNLYKKGGATCEAVEKELEKHEGKSAGKAHKGLKGGGKVSTFVNTKMVDGEKHDSAKGTGGVKMGKAGGYANGGTISGNAGKFANTKVVDGDKTNTAKGTGGVKMGNGGGYAKGGKVDWENRPADTAKAGVSGTSTGGVRNGNAGGFKKGGSAKKAYATGGKVDDGKAVAMPKKPVSRPVANSLQSGTFKKGGKVGKYASAGRVMPTEADFDKVNPVEIDETVKKTNRDLEEAMNPISMAKEGFSKVADFVKSKMKPAGSVTKTEKSVTVAPPTKKRGGKVC
jgi:hypothetical protein